MSNEIKIGDYFKSGHLVIKITKVTHNSVSFRYVDDFYKDIIGQYSINDLGVYLRDGSIERVSLLEITLYEMRGETNGININHPNTLISWM